MSETLTEHNTIITGATPLEERLLGVHPRLHMTLPKLKDLRARVSEQPYAGWVRRVAAVADRAVERPCPPGPAFSGDRGIGDALPNLAMGYLLTEDRRYLDAARQYLLTAADYEGWNTSLGGGHLLHGAGLAYDWLYPFLSDEERQTVRAALDRFGFDMFEAFTTKAGWMATAYTCNHITVCLLGLLTSAAAIYGESFNIVPRLRYVMDKVRVITQALGSDGLSQEGTTYGQYFMERLLPILDLARDLLDIELFTTTDFLANYPYAELYLSLPARHLKRESSLINFGDGPRHPWHGPDYMLRRIAAAYQDEYAQGLADLLEMTGGTRDSCPYYNLLWYDPTVPAMPPVDLPRVAHFDDKDVAVIRSGWDGDESVLAFHCGPHFGHHALEHYAHDIGGGHMHPDAGALQLFAHGDWLLVDDGYTVKQTALENTALINGVGQTGQGHDWFEGLDLRRQKRGPEISYINLEDTLAEYPYVIGNATYAYELDAPLVRYLRHVLAIDESCWLLMDEFEMDERAQIELFFHADQAFDKMDDGTFVTRGERGTLRLMSLWPREAQAQQLVQQPRYPGGAYELQPLNALVLKNGSPANNPLMITLLEAFPSQRDPEITASLLPSEDGYELIVRRREVEHRFILTPGLEDESEPAVHPA